MIVKLFTSYYVYIKVQSNNLEPYLYVLNRVLNECAWMNVTYAFGFALDMFTGLARFPSSAGFFGRLPNSQVAFQNSHHARNKFRWPEYFQKLNKCSFLLSLKKGPTALIVHSRPKIMSHNRELRDNTHLHSDRAVRMLIRYTLNKTMQT